MLLHGIFPPITTPFYPDGNVYFKKLESNVERYSRTPCAGIVVLGSTGEAILLADQERREVLKSVREAAGALNVSEEMLRRALNVGFSGGEKKRLEILQMALFKPVLAILDETDSGLDIDALKLVADGVNALRTPDRGMLVITHYQRLLDYIVPDRVHVLDKGRIVAEGGKELAHELEAKGYAGLARDAA